MTRLEDYYLPGDSKKTAILLMHSLSDSHEKMLELAKDLNAVGYPVLCPDFSNHQDGDLKKVMAGEVSSYQADAAEFYACLQEKGHDNIVVAGMSLGGLMAFDLAHQHTDISALISISTPLFTDISESSVPRFVRNRYFASLPHVDKQVRDDSQVLFDEFKRNLKTFTYWMDDIFPKIRQLTLPVLILEAIEDEVMPAGVGERLCRVLSEADVEFIQYQEGSHYLTNPETYPQVLSDMLAFLEEKL